MSVNAKSATVMSPLTQNDITSFIEDGYVYIRGGFSKIIADNCR